MICTNPCYVHREVFKRTGEVNSYWLGGSKALRSWSYYPDIVKIDFLNGRESLDKPVFSSKTSDVYLIQVPCGQCLSCRIKKSHDWADRLTYHSITEPRAYFLTLTYSDELVTSNGYLSPLNYDDITLFIKRLRNKFRREHIDFYATGEYGSRTFRQHFHAIVYGFEIPDLAFYKVNSHGDPLYTSELLEGLWRNGYVVVCPFNWSTAAYVASYVVKKLNGRRKVEYEAAGLTPEVSRMSRRPGIAHDYYMEHYADIWCNGGLSVPRDVCSSGRLGVPSYFRRLEEKFNMFPDGYQAFLNDSKAQAGLANLDSIRNSSYSLDKLEDMYLLKDLILRRDLST